MSNLCNFFLFILIVIFVCLLLIGVVLVLLLLVKLVLLCILFGLIVFFSMFGNLLWVIEVEVISKLEVMMVRVKGIRKVNFILDNGSGLIFLELDKYVDIDVICFEVFIIIR